MRPSRPVDLPVEQTLWFMDHVVKQPHARILEVGCGDGMLSAKLQERGFCVRAVDRRPEAAQSARTRGVDVFEGDFHDFREGPFDVLLFSRCLHHLELLAGALDHARSLVAPGGLVVAEEFAVEHVDSRTARWFFELRSLLEAAGMIPPDPGGPLVAPSPLERWYELHAAEQPLHAGEDMLVAMGSRLELLDHQRTPYLYRYICERIEETDRGVRVCQWVLELESLRIAERTLRPAGLRMVARV